MVSPELHAARRRLLKERLWACLYVPLIGIVVFGLSMVARTFFSASYWNGTANLFDLDRKRVTSNADDLIIGMLWFVCIAVPACITVFRAYSVRCPNCEKLYYRWWLGVQQLKKTCAHCGFNIWSAPGEPQIGDNA